MIRTLSLLLCCDVSLFSSCDQLEIGTHDTALSASSGTISSTIDFGVLPSSVTPVAQHFGDDGNVSIGTVSSSLSTTDLLDIRRLCQLSLLEQRHTLLRHVQMQGELTNPARQHGVYLGFGHIGESHLVSRFLEFWQTGQHVLHIVDTDTVLATAPKPDPKISLANCRESMACRLGSPSSEASMLLLELVEIGHQLVNRFLHVHVPNLRPDLVFF